MDNGKVNGRRGAGDIGAPCGVYCDGRRILRQAQRPVHVNAGDAVVATSSQIGGIHQGQLAAGVAQLANENIGIPSIAGYHGIGGREVRGSGPAGHIDISCGIHCDPCRSIVFVAAEIRRIVDNRIDDQRPVTIIVSDDEANLPIRPNIVPSVY